MVNFVFLNSKKATNAAAIVAIGFIYLLIPLLD